MEQPTNVFVFVTPPASSLVCEEKNSKWYGCVEEPLAGKTNL